MINYKYPNKDGFFGIYGGSYIPECLFEITNEISNAYFYLKKKNFLSIVYNEIKNFFNRPSCVFYARNISNNLGNNFFFKREDLNFTGSHKINNTIGQILLAKYINKKEIIAETGAGQHGLAVATFSSYYGLKCRIFMGYKDSKKQKTNLKKIISLGAKVNIIKKGKSDLNEAINYALKYWIKNKKSYYLIGSTVGPHPYPTMVRDFQRIIGLECYNFQKKNNFFNKKNYIIACVGGGSNSLGIFYHYIKNKININLIGIEACGKNKNNSVLNNGKLGIMHGCKTLILKKKNKLKNINSISSGLNYPSVGPEHCFLKKKKLVKYKSVTNKQSLFAFKYMIKHESIIPSIESSHAIYYGIKISKKIKKKNIIINLSGNGEKDLRLLK
ncbi:tryptophan synthase subunit beta [Candidatus Vidania fulgoroideorum]